MSRRLLALATVMVLAALPAAAESASKERYLLHCSGCHGGDGRGTPGVTPSLHGLAGLLAARGGREYLARVPGVAQAPLGDALLADLLNWVVSEFSGAAPVPPYSAREVGVLRARPLRDPASGRPVAGR